MIQYKLTPDDVARLLSREKSTVYQWTAQNVASQIPDQLLELLQLKIAK